jgi:clan AA aspartic protease
LIEGEVTSAREAIIVVGVTGRTGKTLKVQAAIDTGFNGWLTLPSALVTELALAQAGTANVVLGDATAVTARMFRAVVDWDGHPRNVTVLQSAAPSVVGMSLLYGTLVTLHVVDGGRVTVDTNP